MYLPQQSFHWLAQPAPSLIGSYDDREQFDKAIKNPEGKSRLRSPIPPDPGYGKDMHASSAPCGGRVLRLHGSDAKTIYKRATANDGAPYHLKFQYSDVFHASHNAKKPLKNHLNENAKRIQRIMRERQKRETIKSKSQPTPVKALWHSTQYDHVQSKVKQKLDEDYSRSSSRSQSVQSNYLRAHANTGPEILRSQSVSNSRRSSVASSVELPTKQIDDKTKPDYIKINSQYVKNIPKVRKNVSTEAIEQAQVKQEKQFQKYKQNQKGRLPDYIEKIKEKRNQDIHEARINAPDPECPPDHIKVDNDQRITTLQQLQFNRTELEKRLRRLPIRTDTLTLKRTKGDIEKKITELDEAIEIFSKPKVFIKIDE